ncbi:hypothetical protein SLA2020_164230 [Shorea laevis]
MSLGRIKKYIFLSKLLISLNTGTPTNQRSMRQNEARYNQRKCLKVFANFDDIQPFSFHLKVSLKMNPNLQTKAVQERAPDKQCFPLLAIFQDQPRSQRWRIPQTTLRHLHHKGKSRKQGQKHKLEIGSEIEEFLGLKGHKEATREVPALVPDLPICIMVPLLAVRGQPLNPSSS